MPYAWMTHILRSEAKRTGSLQMGSPRTLLLPTSLEPPELAWGKSVAQTLVTIGMIAGTVLLAVLYPASVLVVAIAAAAIGGYTHEIVQSGGSVAYPQLKQDGLYLGSVTGLVFGGIAGMLIVQGLPPTASVNFTLISQMFFAGLGLKGIAEAAGGQARL